MVIVISHCDMLPAASNLTGSWKFKAILRVTSPNK